MRRLAIKLTGILAVVLQRVVGLLGLVITTRKAYEQQIMLAGLNGIQAERRVREIETVALRRTIQRLEGKQPNDGAETRPTKI